MLICEFGPPVMTQTVHDPETHARKLKSNTDRSWLYHMTHFGKCWTKKQKSNSLLVYPKFCQSLIVSHDLRQQIVHEKKNKFYGLQINLQKVELKSMNFILFTLQCFLTN